MTWRTFVIAGMLGLFIAGFTYYNDHVIRQTFLTGNSLPAVVFGVVLLWMLLLNPMAGALTASWRRRAGGLAGATWFCLALSTLLLPGAGLGSILGFHQQGRFPGGSVTALLLQTLPAILGMIALTFLMGVTASLALAPRGLEGRLRLACVLATAALAMLLVLRPSGSLHTILEGVNNPSWPGWIQVLLTPLGWWSNLSLATRAVLWLAGLLGVLAGLVALPLSRGRDFVMLRSSEIVLAAALGLVVCAWPGSSLLRHFTQVVVNPGREINVHPSWQAVHLMSYIPDGSPLLAEGFVRDWPGLIAGLNDLERQPGAALRQRLVDRFDSDALALLAQPQATRFRPGDRMVLLRAINIALADPLLIDNTILDGLSLPPAAQSLLARRGQAPLTPHQSQLLNRLALEAALPEVLRPPPAGQGVLFNHGSDDPMLTGPLGGGWSGPGWLPPWEIPWRAWWPVLRLWIGAALLLGLATFCLMLVVHPQWSQRELLPYPTVQFVRQMTAWRPGSLLPEIAHSRLFWLGLGVVFVVHFSNGWQAWYPGFPAIPRSFDFTPLDQLFPILEGVAWQKLLLYPTIYFSVIGFGYLINTRVSISLGLSLPLWVLLGAWVKSYGLVMEAGRWSIDGRGSALRLGAYVGLTLMILYFGRHYYWHLATRAMGLSRRADIPGYAIWAGRGFVVFSALATYLLVALGGLDWFVALLLIAAILMIMLVLARMNVETGLFYVQPDFLPAIILAGWLGVGGLGPATLIVMILASVILVAEPRESLSAYVANSLEMASRVGKTEPRRMTGPLLVWIVAGLGVALVATLTWQYNFGVNETDTFTQLLPRNAMGQSAAAIRQLSASDQLDAAMEITGLAHLTQARPIGQVVHWSLLGLGLVLACAMARMRFAWWPLHPVLFVAWGTVPVNRFAASFMLAGLIKIAVVRITGERGYEKGKPLMIGLIAGELLAILFWSIVGAIYYMNTGQLPRVYRILPA